ncbi:hypothetical protein AGMMS49579_16970 [Spirochaetia bacterium]|nr:hypothetical protein AGMMS49579_16970 [Spirochaetia bacterium]
MKTTKNWSKVLLAGMAAVVLAFGLVVVGCDGGDPDPEYEDVALTGALASYASYLNIRKAYGLPVSDAQLTKLCNGVDFAIGNGTFYAYISGTKLNITINNGSTVSAADGRFVIGTAYIDSHTHAQIGNAIWNYAETELGQTLGL